MPTVFFYMKKLFRILTDALRGQAEQEKTAAVIRAEGEAYAADIISKALQKYGSGMIELRRIETSKEISQTLSQSRNVVYLPTHGSNMLLNLGQ